MHTMKTEAGRRTRHNEGPARTRSPRPSPNRSSRRRHPVQPSHRHEVHCTGSTRMKAREVSPSFHALQSCGDERATSTGTAMMRRDAEELADWARMRALQGGRRSGEGDVGLMRLDRGLPCGERQSSIARSLASMVPMRQWRRNTRARRGLVEPVHDSR